MTILPYLEGQAGLKGKPRQKLPKPLSDHNFHWCGLRHDNHEGPSVPSPCGKYYPLTCPLPNGGIIALRHVPGSLGQHQCRQLSLQRWLNSFHVDAKWHRHRKLRVSQQCFLGLATWRGIPMDSAPSR
ncbi:hypothetical protein EPR50_G00174850 [Perca flavescens]|uniref:Uncharacterized protein n=1 Tax=Perca flavescens TaxID=8167 RepID=A0A484CAI3_PERFV|nr:hypothetical protein EPR50_G00174850 [Perca flavescens]